MKIRIDNGRMEIDLTTKDGRRGNSSINQFVKEPNTQVYYGPLHACVTFKDLNLEVAMDPYEGSWKDGKWARKEAWNALLKVLTPEYLNGFMQSCIELGKEKGGKQARKDIRKSLGIADEAASVRERWGNNE